VKRYLLVEDHALFREGLALLLERRLDGHRLERDEDVLTLRRQDGSLVGRFSARAATTEGVLRVIIDDRRGYPQYAGPEEHAESARRYVRVRMQSPWERFLNTERRMIEARRKGQLAKALLWALPRESQEEIDRMTSEDQRRAEAGLVELKSEGGGSFYKHVEQLVPEDRQERIRAELRRLEWLLERQKTRKIILSSASSRRHPPHKDLELPPSDTVVTAHDQGKPAVRRGRKAHGPLSQRGGRATERSQFVHPSEYEEGHAHTAKAMVGIYFASKDYMEAYKEAYRAFRHAQTAEEHDEQKLIEVVSRLRDLVAHCELYLSEHPEEEESIEQVIDQLVMKRDK